MPMEQFAILMALKAVSRQCPVKSQTFRNIELSSLKYSMNTLGITHEGSVIAGLYYPLVSVLSINKYVATVCCYRTVTFGLETKKLNLLKYYFFHFL